MPRLPDALTLGPRPDLQPQTGVATIDGTAPGKALVQVGKEEVNFGQTVSHLGGTVSAISAEYQKTYDAQVEVINKTRAEDAFNKLREKELDLAHGETGFTTKVGADAATQPLARQYLDLRDQAVKGLTEGLGNDRQKELFRQRADAGAVQYKAALLGHVQKQVEAYKDQIDGATVDLEVKNIAQNYTNDGAMAVGMMRIENAIRTKAVREGWSPEAEGVANAKAMDAAWKARFEAWQVSDPVGAYKAFLANQEQMSPAVRLHLKTQIAGNALPAIAAQEVATGAPVVKQLAPQPGAPIAPSNVRVSAAVEKFGPVIDRQASQFGVDPGVMRRQLQAESGGNPAAVNLKDAAKTGSPSIGIAQFQPATAKRYGIDPTKPDQAIQGQAAYMADLLKMFDGDYQKALAGYNWGEENVRNAVARAAKNGDNWMDYAPRSTQAYVRKIVAPDQRGLDVSDLRADPSQINQGDWGKRPDGTQKGLGFLGALKTADGNVATEYTVGVQINGKQMDVPTLVPTLTRAEVEQVLRAAGGQGDVSNAIVRKAADFARQRVAAGKSVFAEPGESPSQQPASGNRTVDYASMSPAQLLAVKTGNPTIDAMPADDKLRTLGLIHSEALRQRQEKQALLGTREQDARAGYYVNGTAAGAPTSAELVDAYGPVEGMKRARGLDEARQTGETIQRLKTLPQSELERLRNQKPVGGEGFADRQKNYELVTNAVNAVQQQRQADPVQFALATKSYGIQPMTEQTLKDPNALAVELRKRTGAAETMARDYGTVPALLTKAESTAISTVLKQSPIPAQKQFLASMYAGTGDLNSYRALLQNVAPDAPTIALAGLYQVRQHQSEGTDRGRRDVADLILRGHAILNPPKREDGQEHLGGKSLVKMPKDDEMRLAFNSYVGDAFKDKEKAKDLVWQAAKEIYAARQAEEGDDSGNLVSARWNSAMEIATGGIETHNGTNIVLPWGYPYDRFRNELKQRAGQLAPEATGASAEDLARLPLESVGDGRYVFRRGTGYVVDKDGRPLVLDFNPAAPTQLREPAIAAGKLDVRDVAVTRAGAVTGKAR